MVLDVVSLALYCHVWRAARRAARRARRDMEETERWLAGR